MLQNCYWSKKCEKDRLVNELSIFQRKLYVISNIYNSIASTLYWHKPNTTNYFYWKFGSSSKYNNVFHFEKVYKVVWVSGKEL